MVYSTSEYLCAVDGFVLTIMATPALVVPSNGLDSDSRSLVVGSLSHEIVFGVVGHVGSGTSKVANVLDELLKERKIKTHQIRARDIIEDWVRVNGQSLPPAPSEPTLKYVTLLQDAGDEMRRSSKD